MKIQNQEVEVKVKRLIGGALKSTISAHGAISQELIGSATKRIYCQLVASLPELREMLEKDRIDKEKDMSLAA